MSLDPTLNKTLRPPWAAERFDADRCPDDEGGSRESPDAPNLSQGIQPLALTHLPQMAPLFRDVFPDNPLSRLGCAFLRELLASYVTLPGGCGYACLRDGVVAGFVVGSADSRRHRHDLLRERWASLLRPTLRAILRSPALARPLACYLRAYLVPRSAIANPEGPGEPEIPPASLVFLAVAPAYRRHGIATMLTEALLRRLAMHGVEQIKLVVAASNQEALRFYLTHGWHVTGCYPAPTGEPAYRLVRDLHPNPPASPTSDPLGAG